MKSNEQHVQGKGRMGGTHCGHRAYSGGHSGLSHHISDSSRLSSLANEAVPVLEHSVSHISDSSRIPSLSNEATPIFDSNEALVSQVSKETQLLESRDIKDPLKQDKKGKKVLIEASGSVAGQMLANTTAWKKVKARGSAHPLVEPESSPTLLMGIDDLSTKAYRDLDMHQRAVENLENILSNDEEELEFSQDSMAETDESDHAMDINDEIEDSTTLRKYQ